MDWLNIREAVILVPDPIACAPGQALYLSSHKTHRHKLPIARAILVVTKTTSHNFPFYFLKPFGTGKPCVICQDKTRLVEFPLRAVIGARCVRAQGGRSLA